MLVSGRDAREAEEKEKTIALGEAVY